MKINLIARLLIIIMIGSFIIIPVACGSDDGGTPPPKMEDPIADPTNAATTIVATSPVLADGTATSTVTVTIADTKGNRFTTSAGTVSLSATGSATVSSVTDNGDGAYSATVTNTTAETVTISGSLGASAITDTADITFDPVMIPEEDSLIIAINSGGEQVVIDSVTFVKDTLFNMPSLPFANNEITDILETEADTLYVTERIRGTGMSTIGYSIPVDSATYEVKLHFAEIFWGLDGQGGAAGGVGSRIFDVIVEDSVVIDDYDIFADVGAATATIKVHEALVVDDTLNVTLTSTVDQPKISALEVIKKAGN